MFDPVFFEVETLFRHLQGKNKTKVETIYFVTTYCIDEGDRIMVGRK